MREEIKRMTDIVVGVAIGIIIAAVLWVFIVLADVAARLLVLKLATYFRFGGFGQSSNRSCSPTNTGSTRKSGSIARSNASSNSSASFITLRSKNASSAIARLASRSVKSSNRGH
jgi:hypothetical protein